jgi:hypothetical protein
MRNQIIKIVLVSFATLCFFNTVHADTAIHLKISTPVSTIYDEDITVTPCNSDNNATTNLIATPYCAILQSGLQNNWSWFSFGALLNSLNNISGSITKDSQGNDVYNFWDWSLNGTEATTGLTEYTLIPGDIISINFVDPGNTVTSAPSGGAPLVEYMTPATVTSTPDTTTSITPAKPTFDLKKASDFLSLQQKGDGSFGQDLYTDWAGMALTSGNYQDQIIKLIKYLENSDIQTSLLTDYERRALTLMTLGLNPYETNNENYIEKIVSSFDGKQFGDPNEDNDDIFALIALQNAGYTQNDQIISNDISFVLSTQNQNGSWDNSVDMSGAAIEALSTFNQNTWVKSALSKAENFLKQNQKDDGSWNDNASSTAWAIEGILALDENPSNWTSYGNTPLDYLATTQDTDGGIKDTDLQTKIWETAYVVSALSGKDWNQTMQTFAKEETPAVTVINGSIASTEGMPTNSNTASIKNNAVIIIVPHKNNQTKTSSENLASQTVSKTENQNTASVINAVTTSTNSNQTEPTKENWFMRLLHNIFG